MLSINHTSTPSIRLSILRRYCLAENKILYITDASEDISIMRIFARELTGKDWKEVSTLAGFWNCIEAAAGYFFMSHELLTYEGNLIHLKRGSGVMIARGDRITEEDFIDSLISLGYRHGDASDTPGTYMKSGGTLTLRDAIIDQRVQLEWFDTELDSIIIHHEGSREHVANISISACDESKTLKRGETLNPVLVGLLGGTREGNSEVEVCGKEKPIAQNGETEGDKLSESDESSILASEANEFLSPSGAFSTFQSGKVQKENTEYGFPPTIPGNDEKTGLLRASQGQEQTSTGFFVPQNDGNDGNTGLLHTQEGQKNLIILSGGDFLSDKEILLERVDIHMGDFHTHGGISVDGSIPEIASIIELEHLLRDTTLDIHIYTRYLKTITDFLEYNSITGVHITEVNSSKLMSGMWTLPEKDGNTTDSVIPMKEESASLLQKEIPRASEGQKKHLIIADDLLGQIFVKKRTKKSIAKHLDLLLTLKRGDYIVHREHGIALFYSVVKKTLGDIEREYLELHYADGDKLFVPLTEIYRVSRYIGGNHPELTRLSGAEWERTIEKTNEEIEAIAQDILETSAKRSLAKGRAFGVFREEEKKFQEAFTYEYTLDQKSAIDEIFADMESENPMDRLISGDVGFGKTEVAMNAIYKAVLSGTQVAVLSPLLVLTDEHYETFCARLTPFGIRVGVLTRMSTQSEIQYTLDGMRNGNIDVVVGTHRLISDDVTWKRLGLLIIDEEHKFGVTHKEKIKKIKANLDILSLSATPIPRSLNLALSGLKKISILATPPARKKPIETIVTRWNEGVIREAITHELRRGGQVIIIHNRIRGMESMEKEIEVIMKNKEGRIKNKKGKIDENSNIGIHGEKKMQAQDGESKGEELSESDESNTLMSGANEFSSPLEPFGTFQLGKVPNRKMKHGFLPTQEGQKRELRIIITHGQMPAEHIEERIHAFKKREYDILLTTTIIENGVNFLSANTIIIIDPEEFGLASLHQLRGRVGRKDIDGRCYLMYRKPELAGDEKERLITIANNTHLGAGFEIAMRDMEIRGAGDVLGIKQAGRSKDVGLTLYFRLLEEKVEELKNARKTRTWTKIELELSYVIPDDYFTSEADKLSFYREIENIETLEELEEIEEELGVKSYEGRVYAGKEKIVNSNISGFGGGNLSKNSSTKNSIRTEFSSGEENKLMDEQSEFGASFSSPNAFGTFGSKSTENGVGRNIQSQNISNLFLLLRARIVLSEYGVEKLSRVGMNYTFDFVDGTDGTKIKSFLDRFDRKKNYILLSMQKIRVETRYYRGVEDFLSSLR